MDSEEQPTHVHHFDRISGWCSGCNYRDDGRLISRDGTVWRPGPSYTTAELTAMADRLKRPDQPARFS